MTTPPPRDSLSAEVTQWMSRTPGLASDRDVAVEAARQRIGRVSRMLGAVLAEVSDAHHLTTGDWEALSVLARADGTCTPTRLAEVLALTSGTVSTRIRRLSSAGLITFTDATDKRSRPIRLTPAGLDAWQGATADRVRTERGLFRVLGDAEIDALNELLAELLASFEAHYGQAPAHDRVS